MLQKAYILYVLYVCYVQKRNIYIHTAQNYKSL